MRKAPAPAVVASPVTDYAVRVVEGEIVAGRLVRLACQRHLRDLQDGAARGLWFDEEAAQFAIDFFEIPRHYVGEWAGRPLTLQPWQAFRVGSVFGWKRADGTRRFRKAYHEVARKNGKTTEAAAVGLLVGFFDGEPGAEVYCAATKRDQAKEVWDDAAYMVKGSPSLSRRLTVLMSTSHLVDYRTASKMLPLGADEGKTDGLNPHAVVCDELHAWKEGTAFGVRANRGQGDGGLHIQATSAQFLGPDRVLYFLRDDAFGGLFRHDLATGKELRLMHRQRFLPALQLARLHAGDVTVVDVGDFVADRDTGYNAAANPVSVPVVKSLYPMMNCVDGLTQAMPLTSNWSNLHARIDTMNASGMTNITLGAQWGYEMLSNNAPFTQASTADNVERFMILLTDGQNTQDRWGAYDETRMNKDTKAMCDAITERGVAESAKKLKITLYTVLVIDGNEPLLKSCASSPDKYSKVNKASELEAVFKKIAEDIGQIRLTM